ncbi:aldo/keto reductase [Eubacterium callanderi]|uniref:aldo/keto reductase n=1 Tax=Eubacterium callanderi TaxID=53442 RepID=UPI001C11AD3B|nr:aldo/keto reductase [Eubacterium callanderi]MBU5302101.1 aldo/keto reductase [Eubacterium callanderi]
MQYRPFKELKLSQLGFGTMRFPIKYNNEKLIDEKAAGQCLQTAIDAGVNYFDTAWPYHKQASEPFLGKFLAETGQRDKVQLATKLPCWQCHDPADADRYLDEQLKRLQTSHIDFYLLHALDGYRFKKLLELGIIDFMNRAKTSGKVRYLGFSFHDLGAEFEPILDAYPFDFVQIQLNYMDENFQAGLAGLKAAHERGMGVMIMEPLRGGQLAAKPEGDLERLWQGFDTSLTPPELGFKYLYNMPEVTCVLSGMSDLRQVQENIATAGKYTTGCLTEDEKEMIQKLRSFYRSRMRADCTGCRYCNGCPQIIPIPSIFKYYNEAFMYGDVAASRKKYRTNIKNKFKADQCTGCGQCEEHCPQNLEIRALLTKAHAFLMDEG